MSIKKLYTQVGECFKSLSEMLTEDGLIGKLFAIFSGIVIFVLFLFHLFLNLVAFPIIALFDVDLRAFKIWSIGTTIWAVTIFPIIIYNL